MTRPGFPGRRILRLRLPKTCLGLTKKKSGASVGTCKKCVGMKNNYTLRIPWESLLTKSNCFNLFLRWFQFRILWFHLHFCQFFHNLFLEQGHYRLATSVISIIFFLCKQPSYDGNLWILLTGMAYGNFLVPTFALHLYASDILGVDPISGFIFNIVCSVWVSEKPIVHKQKQQKKAP